MSIENSALADVWRLFIEIERRVYVATMHDEIFAMRTPSDCAPKSWRIVASSLCKGY